MNTLLGLDFKTINTIAQVYNQKDEYKLLSHRLFAEKIWDLNNETTDEVFGRFSWLHDGIALEKL